MMIDHISPVLQWENPIEIDPNYDSWYSKVKPSPLVDGNRERTFESKWMREPALHREVFYESRESTNFAVKHQIAQLEQVMRAEIRALRDEFAEVLAKRPDTSTALIHPLAAPTAAQLKPVSDLQNEDEVVDLLIAISDQEDRQLDSETVAFIERCLADQGSPRSRAAAARAIVVALTPDEARSKLEDALHNEANSYVASAMRGALDEVAL